MLKTKQNEDFLSHIPLPTSLFRDEADDTPERNSASSSAEAAAAATAKAIARTLRDEMATPAKLPSNDNLSRETQKLVQKNSLEVPQTPNQKTEQQSTSNQDNQKQDIPNSNLVTSPQPTVPGAKHSPGSPDEIPQSMVDIYKLSNKTRQKKKKQKKDGKATAKEGESNNRPSAEASPVSPLLMRADGGGTTMVSVAIVDSPVKKAQQPQQPPPSQLKQSQPKQSLQLQPVQVQKQPSQASVLQQKPQKPQSTQVIDLDPDADSDTKSSVNFMKSIGWVDSNDDILLEQQQPQLQGQPQSQPKQHQNAQHPGRGRGNFNRGNRGGSGRGGRGNGRGRGNYYH